jgi:UrcA family protein
VNTKIKFRSAALIAGAMISLGAMAQSPEGDVQVNTQMVKFNRSEASTPAGAADLYQSLNQAAARVCVDSSSLLQRGSYSECRDAALTKAVDDVKIEAVSVLLQTDRTRKGTVTVGQG